MCLEKWLKLILLIILFGILINCLNILNTNKTPIVPTNTNSNNNNSNSNNNSNNNINNNMNQCNDKCSTKSTDGCKSCSSLLPVLEPRFNMREICKQSILLEDHLFQKEKRCHDCICKHFLTIEGLAEEAITLDKEHKHPDLVDLPQKIRVIEKNYLNNYTDPKQPAITGQELREIRKGYMQQCFDAF